MKQEQSRMPLLAVINTGSTSTKLAVFKGNELLFEDKIAHSETELNRLKNFEEQVDYRLNIILNHLKKQEIIPDKFDLIMARGGLIKPVVSGVYKVNKQMLHDLKYAPKQHASNLAAAIGMRLGNDKIPVYIADPVVVDEMQDIARYSGHRLFTRKSIFHALNHKAVARKFAGETQQDYNRLNLIIAHMGGGISVGAHQKGKVIDVNQALDGEGPFSPERSGTLPAGDLVRMAFSGNYTQDEMLKMITGKGGLVSYLGTNNLEEIEKNLNPENQKILDALAYQVSKSIGEMATVLKGQVDAIILTGGLAYSSLITDSIKERVVFIAPVHIFPGEDEMRALAQNALLLWQNKLKLKTYK